MQRGSGMMQKGLGGACVRDDASVVGVGVYEAQRHWEWRGAMQTFCMHHLRLLSTTKSETAPGTLSLDVQGKHTTNLNAGKKFKSETATSFKFNVVPDLLMEPSEKSNEV